MFSVVYKIMLKNKRIGKYEKNKEKVGVYMNNLKLAYCNECE